MTIEDMNKAIKKLGMKLRYKPIWNFENEHIELSCRKPATINEGLLTGSQAVCVDDGVQVWTPKRRLAKDISIILKCPIRMFDTEAEITIPYPHIDTYARKLGIRIRKQGIPPTPNQLKNHFRKGQINR